LREDPKGYSVLGEIFLVTDHTLRALDGLEGVPYLYRRATIEMENFEHPVIGYIYQREVSRLEECTNGIWTP
jgi:gamma-glutamylcyclotransferase (GGCT)/AIG2-like uncharacterized protein YtfP